MPKKPADAPRLDAAPIDADPVLSANPQRPAAPRDPASVPPAGMAAPPGVAPFDVRTAGAGMLESGVAQPPRPSCRLTARQRSFVDHYLVMGQPKAAALRAGYSKSYTHRCVYALLKRPDIAALIAEGRAAAQRRTGVTVDRVIAELAKIAFADPRDLFAADGSLKPIHDLDDDSAAGIAAMEVLAMAGRQPGRSRTAPARTAPARATPARTTPGTRATRARIKSAADLATGAVVTGRGAAGKGATGEGMPGERMTGGEAEEAAPDGEVVGGKATIAPLVETRKIKNWDKLRALELLGRYLGLFKDRLELGVDADLAASLEAARRRVQARGVSERELEVSAGDMPACEMDEKMHGAQRPPVIDVALPEDGEVADGEGESGEGENWEMG